MIEKMTWIQFDREYSEFTQWPLELNYNVYCDLVDQFNECLEKLEKDKDKEEQKD